uniref:Secreted protein n=1 Tax=Setaria italica TaxID=4555 RepID=K4AJL7_SETIT
MQGLHAKLGLFFPSILLLTAQQIIATPKVYISPPFGSHFAIQVQYYLILVGTSVAPKHIPTTPHTTLATGH